MTAIRRRVGITPYNYPLGPFSTERSGVAHPFEHRDLANLAHYAPRLQIPHGVAVYFRLGPAEYGLRRLRVAHEWRTPRVAENLHTHLRY
jgi:hypothetical protein